ncbi:GPI transamidase component PIG-T [Phlyctochytrium arcticum]|nr:GPI transamidase component PIG-T [Phlyctochytrium arcticum]
MLFRQDSPFHLVLLFLSTYILPITGEEVYSEFLKLSQYFDAKVLAEFRFPRVIGESEVLKARANHYNLLPRPIGEIIQTYNVSEFHLTFTRGVWDSDKWGTDHELLAPGGVQLWAWFEGDDVDRQWKGLTHALGGLFCSSLNFMDQTVTAEPVLSFRARNGRGNPTEQIRYASLPREAVCTENLTPWAKLLPCETKAGISSLFNAYRLFDGVYHSMGTHVTPRCLDEECTRKDLVFEQTLAVVLDPLRLDGRPDWSLQTLFERKITSGCPLASRTEVSVEVPKLEEGPTFRPVPAVEETSSPGLINALYNITKETPPNLDIGVSWNGVALSSPSIRSSTPQPYLHAHRYLTGYGYERGGLAVDLQNRHPTDPIQLTYMESIPWILKFYLSTLKVETTSDSDADIVGDMYYQPAIDRDRPTVLELQITLPPNSTSTLSIDFDKTFIKYTEHPPDANRGFDIGSAILTINETHKRVYTETLLVALPTPDFSMPYNVITLTCTLLALFFGSMFNLLTRRFEPLKVK